MIGKVISEYKISRQLGRGNCFTLFEGYSLKSEEKKVIIKIIDPEPSKNKEIREKFNYLERLLISIDHPHLAKELAFISTEDKLITMSEMLIGQNLKFTTLIKNLSFEENIKIFKQTLEAVIFLHQQNIVHRDLRPENIFLTDNYKKVKVLDAGLAEILNYDHPSKIGKRVDPPMFLSPEQAKGDAVIDYKSDIYSLGVVLYFMYNRKLPFQNTSSYQEILNQIINEPIPEIPFDKEVNAVVQKSTQKNPADRYQSVQEILEDIKKIG